MDIQALLNKFSEGEMYKRVATGQNMSLGGLIEALRLCPDEAHVADRQGVSPDALGSYRGYYSDLAIEPAWDSAKLDTVGKLRAALEKAVGATFEGYKGGAFVMQKHTPVWWASYGQCGEAVYGLRLRNEGEVELLTRQEEAE